MFRFIHSADWQLGARFSQFGSRAPQLREARLATLKRALELAQEHEVDAFVVAGDLFEDNQVEETLVANVVGLFSDYPKVRIFILPGNHDPISGPESVWMRKSFLNAPKNIHAFTKAEAVALGSAWLIASPLQQKLSTTDPSLKIAELAAGLPSGLIKVGITHGALAIEGKHQPNDFPIALNAATRAGLDYLAIGHWHNWLADTDGGRIVMPGTPEPDQFEHERSGQIALVEIQSPGQLPNVQSLPVATLTWDRFAFDFLAEEASRTAITRDLATLSPKAANSVIRVVLNGTASPSQLTEVRGWLETALRPFLVGQLVDRTTVSLTPAELEDLRTRHPILAQVLSDISQLETLATGSSSSAIAPVGTQQLSLSEAQELLAQAKIDLTKLTAENFKLTRSVLIQTMQEVSP